MIWPLTRRDPRPDTISTLYGMIVAHARLPCFYRDYAVADTVNGRFELIVVHLTLVLDRLAAEPALRDVWQGLFDRFCQDMDDNLREMGISDLKVPKEMGGPGGAATNPEQLFAAGYAACFEGAVRYVANQKKVSIPADTSVTAHVGIGPREPTGFGIVVQLDVHLPGLDRAVAQDLADTAHRDICPYSHATRNNVDVTIKLV